MKKTSIIITNRNGLPLLQRCIQSIKKYTDIPYEIIVVDDGSTDGTVEYCRQQQVRFISTPSSRGGSRACNLGLHLASGDALMLLDNAVVASPDWLTTLLHCLYSSEEIGIVSPMTHHARGRGMGEMPSILPAPSAEVANIPDLPKWLSAKRLDRYCFLIKRELVEHIGFFDEQFSFGHFEDDYCYRAQLSGYRLLIAGDSLVYHLGSTDFNKEGDKELQSLINQNHNKFVQKWGVDPHSLVKLDGGELA
ncbi:Glycosyltransferase, GT2 family [Paenibacillus sp. 1_12]|uniref:glycosyltransferase family 2 protein n=1 Tax=Paenibacillus sp. 1_12 TaxID=1566278 RepID=UPI0008E7155A|nr:glycosyltransferase family 2 protein [Paenibacillus sp. 1_12]SFK71846.1 Glycosyltransferase, GT2 family [Paenibacillus sp. 1_12]